MLGALAGPIFTLAWLLEGPACADYDPMQHAISTLSLCETGWIQNTLLILTGLLTFALTLGLRDVLRGWGRLTWVLILFGIVGIGFMGAGLFVTDPLNGHPPGTPPLPLPPTFSGGLHLFFSALIFGLPAAALVLTKVFKDRNEHHWAVYSGATGISFLLVYALALAGFLQVEGLIDYAGLFQRIALTIGLTWMTLLPSSLLKSSSGRQAA